MVPCSTQSGGHAVSICLRSGGFLARSHTRHTGGALLLCVLHCVEVALARSHMRHTGGALLLLVYSTRRGPFCSMLGGALHVRLHIQSLAGHHAAIYLEHAAIIP